MTCLNQLHWWPSMAWWKPVTPQHQQPRLFLKQGLRCLEISRFLGFQHCEGDTLHWSDPLQYWKLVTAWHLHVSPCDRNELDCYTNAASIGNTCKTLASVCSCKIEKVVQCSAHSRTGKLTGTCKVIPGNARIPGSRQTAASATKNLLDTRFAVSAKVQLSQLSTLRRRHSSLIWTLARMETAKRMVLSQWSLSDTCICETFLQYWWSTWTGQPHECPINWQDWQDIELR